MLVFSTCWNSGRHKDGEAMIDEILALGVDTVELSHGIKSYLLPGIMKAYEDGRVKVAGVHNFFPSPVDVMGDSPDAYEFTSFKENDRFRAMKLTKKSLEYSCKFDAQYIVLHMGRVDLLKRQYSSSVLQEMVKEGLAGMNEYAEKKAEAVYARQKVSPLYYGRALTALRELSTEAASCGMMLGVESRSHFEQVPSEEEMRMLMREFVEDQHVGYWHDFGHVQRKHNLLLVDHAQWLEEMSPYLVGCHVNDVEWPARDHRVPFTGHVDFDALMKWVKPGLPMVWELSSGRRSAEIREALAIWRDKFPQHC